MEYVPGQCVKPNTSTMTATDDGHRQLSNKLLPSHYVRNKFH